MSKDFGNRVITLLREQRKSQKLLAAELDLTEVTLSRYLTGEREPNADTVIKIAQKLNVSTDYLLLGKSASESAKEIQAAVGKDKDGAKNVAVSFAVIAGMILLAIGLGVLSNKEKDDLAEMLKKGGERE